LKKTSLGPLRQGQRLDTSETKQCSSKNHKPPKNIRAPLHICKIPLNKCQTWAQTDQAGSQNRSDRFHTTDHTPQKPKMQKKCTRSPLTLGIGSRDAMQLFSTFLSPPCCQCMIQGSKCLSSIQNSSQDATHVQMSKLDTLQLRNDINFMITKFRNQRRN
jgi:hypothetical protein